MDKKGLEAIYETLAQILIIILFFSACIFFIISSKNIEIEKVALLEIVYACTIFDDAIIEINSSYFNVSQIKYDNENFFFEGKNYKEKYYGKNKIKIENGIIEIKK
ncbi:MAG: hypothetical protein QXQ30_01175 [Candidatus Pacearchaeota archaeon]